MARANDDHEDLRHLLAQIPEGDLTLIVLKGHLIVEQLLLKYIEVVSPNPAPVLKLNRLSFYVLTRFARALFEESPIAESHLWEPIDRLNAARNGLAHDLDSAKLHQKVDALIEGYEKKARAWRPQEYRQGDRTIKTRYAIVGIIHFLVGAITARRKQQAADE